MRCRFLVPALCGVLPVLLSACGTAPQADPRTAPPVVRTATVEAGPGTRSRTFTGTIAARVQSDLAFRVPGKVLERLVDNGQVVQRGQLLYRIDPVDLDLGADAQRQAVVAARAQAAHASAEEARYRELQEKKLVSRSAYELVKASSDAASAQLRAAQAQSAVARNASLYSRLLADADGIVTEVLAEPGQVVAAGQVIVRVARSGRREAVVQLPETIRPEIGSQATASLFSGPKRIPVRLRVLSGAADAATRTFEARYTLEQDDAELPLGATVAVELAGTHPGEADEGFEVPLASLLDPGTGTGVWLISGSPMRARWQPVKIKRIGDESAFVEGSLKQGDRVAALGAHLLRADQEVRVESGPVDASGKAVASKAAAR